MATLMKTAIILHGMSDSQEAYDGNEAGHHWIPWLKGELERRGFMVHTPEMPEPYAPHYEEWLRVFEQFPLDKETVLVGHSCGAGFLVRYLSEHAAEAGKVLLVGPYLDPDRDHVPEFFDFAIKHDFAKQTAGTVVFVSADDDAEILESVERLKANCEGIEIRAFQDKGHFTYDDMKTEEFPELLQEIAGNGPLK